MHTTFQKLIEEAEKQVAIKRRALEEQENALLVLKKMASETLIQDSSVITPAQPQEDIKFDDLFTGGIARKKSQLVDDIRKLVSQFGQNEFTVDIVKAALDKVGVVINAEKPKPRISVALGKLVDEKILKIVVKGAGNAPNVYKLNDEFDDLIG